MYDAKSSILINYKMKTPINILLGLWLLLAGCEGYDPDQPGLLVPLTVDQDSSLPSIRVNNTQLHAEAFGDPMNPMIVVLHGGPGSDYRSLLNCQAFAQMGYYVVFFDQRGSGLSKRETKESYTLQLMLDDLTAVIEHYRSAPGQKVILLGHSWGAMLATIYINTYPQAIAGAILCEPGGFVWSDIMAYVERSRSYGLNSETLNDVTYLDQFMSGKITDHERMDYKAGLTSFTDWADDNPIGNEGHLPFWRLGAVVNKAMFDLGMKDQPDWTQNLQAFDTNVLFIYSERNRAYGLSHARLVSSAYPKVELVRIDDAGHDMLAFAAGWNNFFPIALNYLNELGL